MRGVDDRLHDLLVALAGQLVEQQRQNDRDRERHQQIANADGQGVLQQLGKVRRGEEAFKVLEAHPGAAPDALHRLVVAEGDLQTIHGIIAEHQKIRHGGQQKQIQLPVGQDAFQHMAGRSTSSSGTYGGRCLTHMNTPYSLVLLAPVYGIYHKSSISIL